jgi:hypothetical protein
MAQTESLFEQMVKLINESSLSPVEILGILEVLKIKLVNSIEEEENV